MSFYCQGQKQTKKSKERKLLTYTVLTVCDIQCQSIDLNETFCHNNMLSFVIFLSTDFDSARSALFKFQTSVSTFLREASGSSLLHSLVLYSSLIHCATLINTVTIKSELEESVFAGVYFFLVTLGR